MAANTPSKSKSGVRKDDALLTRLLAGPIGIIVVTGYLAVITWLIWEEPRALMLRFGLFIGLLLVYYMPHKWWIKLLLAGTTLLAIIPAVGLKNPFLLEIGFQVAAFATLALGLNIVVGFAGLLDLGYVAFFAVGAYLWAFFGSQQIWHLFDAPGTFQTYSTFPFPAWWFWPFLLVGVIAAAGAGILLGTPVLRLRGDYLAIVTLGFGEVIRVLANNLDKPINLTNGPQGITPIQRPPLPDFMTMGAFPATLSRIAGRTISEGDIYAFFFYFLALALLMFTIVMASRLENSRLGRSWTAIREDDVAAVAMGVPLRRTKLTAFAIGAAFSGAMGVIYAANRTFVSPETFSLTQSISILVMVILGGLGSIPGVILGAAIVTLLNIDILQTLSLQLSSLRQGDGLIPGLGIPWAEVPSQLDPARYQRLVFGLLLIIMMIVRPEGIIPSKRQRLELHEDDDDEIIPPSNSASVAPAQGGD
ncbi:MAG: branched-chain amino acid ABC transporter permease [Caldilineaceae bacterium]